MIKTFNLTFYNWIKYDLSIDKHNYIMMLYCKWSLCWCIDINGDDDDDDDDDEYLCYWYYNLHN